MSDDHPAGVPAQYKPVMLESGFARDNSELYWREEPGAMMFGMRLDARHSNILGTCHGGWIATFFDVTLALTGRFSVPELESRALITINLSVDYLDAARSGDWLEARGSVLRRTGRMVFVQGQLQVHDRPIARGSGIFRIGPEAIPAR